MSLTVFSFIFVGSVYFALGFLHIIIYSLRRELKVDLSFSCVALSVAISTFFEIWAFKTGSLPEYIILFKATLTVQCIFWICFAWFVHVFTQSTRLWPPILVTILYSVALVINIFLPNSILFSEIVELVAFSLSNGETIYYVNGTVHPLRIIADISWVVFLIYTLFASVEYGRKGNTRKAIIFATTIFLCIGLGYLQGTLIDLGILDPPYLGSFLFLPLAIVMSFSLAGNVVTASRLSGEIEIAEIRWRNFFENVNLLVCGVDHDTKIFYVNPNFLKTTGYKKNEILNHSFVDIVAENDRNFVIGRLGEVFSAESSIVPERKLSIVCKSGELREIYWSNVLQSNGDVPTGILSIGKDITNQIKAENDRDKAVEELRLFKEKLEEENISLKEIMQAEHGFAEIIGGSDELLYVLNKIQQVAQTDSTVLIIGETGTGKELVASAIHQESDRSDKPFIRVNCAAIPSDLVESELFGHEAGAFTNAIKLRRGKFELADGGTIFLDEIGEMPLAAQAKLLSVLQEKELERIGGSNTIALDVRVISATNRDLALEIAEGRFRADLFYRINVYPITVPPLRSRKSDVPLLVMHFISNFNKNFGKNIEDIPQIVMDTLVSYDWPGNIRELRNILERAVITCTTKSLHIPDELHGKQKVINQNSEFTAETEFLSLEEVERRHIQRVLQRTDWQISGSGGAAKILQLNPSTLRSRMKKLGLQKN